MFVYICYLMLFYLAVRSASQAAADPPTETPNFKGANS